MTDDIPEPSKIILVITFTCDHTERMKDKKTKNCMDKLELGRNLGSDFKSEDKFLTCKKLLANKHVVSLL